MGVGAAVDPFVVAATSFEIFIPKSLGRFLNTRLSLSLSELGGKGYDFANSILAGRATDADEPEPADAEVKVDVELPAVDEEAETEADNDVDDAVVLVPGFKRGEVGLDLVLISPAELDLLGVIPIAYPPPPPPLPPPVPIPPSMSELNPPPRANPNPPGLGGNGSPPPSVPMRMRISRSSVSLSIWLICSRVRMGMATVIVFVLAFEFVVEFMVDGWLGDVEGDGDGRDGEDGDLGDARELNVVNKGGGDRGLCCPCTAFPPPRNCGGDVLIWIGKVPPPPPPPRETCSSSSSPSSSSCSRSSSSRSELLSATCPAPETVTR